MVGIAVPRSMDGTDDAAHMPIVEDDAEIASLLAGFPRGAGLAVGGFEAGAGLDRSLAQGPRPDVVALDPMVPGEDGLSIPPCIRAANGPPVATLTAGAEDVDGVLEVGAGDGVSVPFESRVLPARVRAVLRRTRSGAPDVCPPAMADPVVNPVAAEPPRPGLRLGRGRDTAAARSARLTH